MSINPPPNPNLDTFNNEYWIEDPNSSLDSRYCRFPTAQGALTVPDLNLNNSRIHLGTGSVSTGTNAIAIGTSTTATAADNIAIGNGAGAVSGGGTSGAGVVSIGAGAGASSALNQYAVNLGLNAGSNNTNGRNCINIGRNAGSHAAMANNSIQINATGVNISSQTTSNSCVITPIRTIAVPEQNDFNIFYNDTTKELYKSIMTYGVGTFGSAVVTNTFQGNIYSILSIPVGLWYFEWKVYNTDLVTTYYAFQVQFNKTGGAPTAFSSSNFGALSSRMPTAVTYSTTTPLTLNNGFLYYSDAANTDAYLVGYATFTGGALPTSNFLLTVRRIR